MEETAQMPNAVQKSFRLNGLRWEIVRLPVIVGLSSDLCCNARRQLMGALLGGRERAACCTVKKTPLRKAMCTLVDRLDGEDGDNDPSDMKRALEPRGQKERIEIIFVGWKMYYIVAGYPPIGDLFRIRLSDLVLKQAIRTAKYLCAKKVMEATPLPEKPATKDLKGLEAEHPWDKKLQKYFLQNSGEGVLPSGRLSRYGRLPRAFLQDKWDEANAKLAKAGPVGNSKGKSPARPSERFAECFGSRFNPFPFMAVEKGLNNAKGKLFAYQDPVGLNVIRDRSRTAVESDSDADVDAMLSHFQVVSGPVVQPTHVHLTDITRPFLCLSTFAITDSGSA